MTARKKIVVTTAVLFTLAAGGVAVALWSATGSGSGQAQATTAVAAEIAAASGEPDLFPGFTDGDVFFTITNDNPYDIEFTDMTAGTVTSSDEANCPASNVTVAGASGLSLLAPANSTTGVLSIADVVTMDQAAPDGCQGVTFEVELTLTGSQVAS